MLQYRVEDIKLEMSLAGGDVESAWPSCENDTLLDLLMQLFPSLKEQIDSVSEVRLIFQVREK